MQRWEADGTYRFDRTAQPRPGIRHRHAAADRQRVAAHRPRVQLHPHRHVARFQRMRGKTVFYPIGWDDNGLATERRVQNVTGVRCDPSLPYDPAFTPPFNGDVPKDHRAVPVSRPNFVELVPQRDPRRRGGVRAARPPARHLDRLVAALHHHRRALPSVSASWRSCTTSHAARPTSRTRRRCTTSTSEPPSPRPRWKTASVPGAYHKLAFHRTDGGGDLLDRHDSARAARQLRRDGRPPRRRALPSRCSARRCAPRCSRSRCRCSPTTWPIPRRAPASP